MKRLLRIFLLVWVLAGNVSGQAAEPVFIDRSDSGPARASLRSDAVPISGYPTVLSLALSVKSMRLRAIDINGEVLQWSVNPPNQEGVIDKLDDEPVCASLSADAKWLASADGKGVVAVTDAEKSIAVFSDDELEENTVALSFSRDARRLGGVT